MAAAAVLIIGLGALAYQLWDFLGPSYPVAIPVTVDLEPMLADAMIQRHSACASLADHRLVPGSSESDFAAISTHLTEVLSRPAFAYPVNGWTFRGAGICQVDSEPAGHLLFTRGDATLSMFSLPAPHSYGYTDGAQYQQSKGSYAIAGYARTGALFCLVVSSPSGSISLKELKRLRDELQMLDAATCGLEFAPAPPADH